MRNGGNTCETFDCERAPVASVQIEGQGWFRYCEECAEKLERSGDETRWDTDRPLAPVKTLVVGRRSGKTKAMLDALGEERDLYKQQRDELLAAIEAHRTQQNGAPRGNVTAADGSLYRAAERVRKGQ